MPFFTHPSSSEAAHTPVPSVCTLTLLPSCCWLLAFWEPFTGWGRCPKVSHLHPTVPVKDQKRNQNMWDRTSWKTAPATEHPSALPVSHSYLPCSLQADSCSHPACAVCSQPRISAHQMAARAPVVPASHTGTDKQRPHGRKLFSLSHVTEGPKIALWDHRCTARWSCGATRRCAALLLLLLTRPVV